ncbi:MAG: DUF6077 domain-containing protein [Oscillospiraceae bacterium]
MQLILSMVLFLSSYAISLIAFGTFITSNVQSVKHSLCVNIIVGFFCFYALFEVVSLPFVLLLQPFKRFEIVWMCIWVAVVILSAVFKRKQWASIYKNAISAIKSIPIVLLVVAAVTVVQIVIVVATTYSDMDNMYYISEVNTTLSSGTMYQMNPVLGEQLESMSLRYAVSTYSVSNSLMCDVFGIPASVMMKIALPVALITISNMIYYKIAQQLFKDNKVAIGIFMACILLLLFFGNYSIYTPARFTLFRIAQGKGIVVAIIAPMLIYLFLRIANNRSERFNWQMLFTLCLASVNITLTAAFIVPIGITAFAAPLMIAKKNVKILPKYLLCMIPCLVFGVIYLLAIQGMIEVKL